MSEAQANSGGKCDACASGMRLQNGVLKGREKVAGSASEQVVANGNPMYVYILGAFRAFLQFKLKRRMFEGYGKVKPHPMPPGTSNGCLCEAKLAWLHALGVRTSEKTEGDLREAVAVALMTEEPFTAQMLALAKWQDKLSKLIPTPIATDFRLLPIPILVPVLLPGGRKWRRLKFYGWAALQKGNWARRAGKIISFGSAEDLIKKCCEMSALGIIAVLPQEQGVLGHTYVICGVECDNAAKPPSCAYLVVDVNTDPLNYLMIRPTGTADRNDGNAIPASITRMSNDWGEPVSSPVSVRVVLIESAT